MTDELESGPSILCPACVSYVCIPDAHDLLWLECPKCGHEWMSSTQARRKEERAPSAKARVTNSIGTLPVLGVLIYLTGAMLACGLVGLLGAILLGVSPRSGVLRSLGLMFLWVSGVFLGKSPFVFLLGLGVLIAGIALVNQGGPPEPEKLPMAEEDVPLAELVEEEPDSSDGSAR